MRKKFSQLKCDYNETVKCFEWNTAKVKWKNDCKLCLPIVDHQQSDTRERVDVLTDNVQQQNRCEKFHSGVEIGSNYSNRLERLSPIQTYRNDSASPVNCSSTTENPPVPNADVESTNKLNNSAVSDTESSVNTWASKDCVSLNQGLDSTNITTGKTLPKHIVTHENVDQAETDKATCMVVDEKICNGPPKGSGVLGRSRKHPDLPQRGNCPPPLHVSYILLSLEVYSPSLQRFPLWGEHEPFLK